ncbi:hypothetical protein AOLI_G00159110 [Acnodon oligacanthus]
MDGTGAPAAKELALLAIVLARTPHAHCFDSVELCRLIAALLGTVHADLLASSMKVEMSQMCRALREPNAVQLMLVLRTMQVILAALMTGNPLKLRV